MLPDGTPCNSMYCCQVRKRPHCEHCQKTLPIDDTKHLMVTQSQSKQKHSSRVSAAATIASGKISPKDSSQHQCAKTRLHVLYTGCAWSHNRYGCVMIETHTHTHTRTHKPTCIQERTETDVPSHMLTSPNKKSREQGS